MWPLYNFGVSRNVLGIVGFVHSTTIYATSLLFFTEYFIQAHKWKA